MTASLPEKRISRLARGRVEELAESRQSSLRQKRGAVRSCLLINLPAIPAEIVVIPQKIALLLPPAPEVYQHPPLADAHLCGERRAIPRTFSKTISTRFSMINGDSGCARNHRPRIEKRAMRFYSNSEHL
jgi:hypothetical protein